MALEVIRIEGFIYAKLTGDTGVGGLNTLVNGRIYNRLAPDKATRPLVIYTWLRDSVVQGTGTNRTLLRALYQVEVIGQPKTSPQRDTMRAAADRIDALLGHTLNGSFDSYAFNSWLFQSISRTELNPQTQERYERLGGLFWLEASPL